MRTVLLRELVNQIRGIRAELAENLEKVSGDWRSSDDFKLAQKNALVEDARTKLAELAAKVDDALPDMAEYQAMLEKFDYTDEKLTAALALIRTEGKSLPEPAWRQMVSDFKRRPAVLSYLSDVLGKSGLVDAAVEAKETAQRVGYEANTPNRLADAIVYAARENPEKDFDFSGIMRDMDKLDSIESELAEPSEEQA